MDDYKRALSELPAIAHAIVDANADIVRERFFFDTAEPFRAFHGPRVT